MNARLDSKNGKYDVFLQDASLEDCINLFDQLDANNYTLLDVEDKDECILIGGGNGQYVVVRQKNPDDFLTLCNTEHDDKIIFLCVGGQLGDFSANMVVNHDLAYKALQEFFMKYKKTDLQWVRN